MVQIDKDEYYFHNVKPEKFQLYYHLIKTILNLNVRNVLEIGIGQGLVSHVLKFNNLKVVTGDFDRSLAPEIVCDISQLPFKKESFDLMVASEILEHIPFADVEMAFANIHHLTNKYAVISVPFNQHHVAMHLNIKINKYLYFRGLVNNILNKIFQLYLYFGLSQRNRDFPHHR